ncbi:MAG: LacI family DNA-binding transcriptional regulator [Fusicatenibacter sp.]|nr:LacI family transcriptional regulator [Fusicatenibacter sp.]
MNKVKITDIAERSGVSLTTVSRYFNHPELLSQETQEKIRQAIEDLNYRQDHLARILVTGESNLVGVIFPHLHLSFYTELLNQLVRYGKEKGYNFIVYTSDESREEEIQMIQSLLSYRIKGLILLSHLLSASEIEALPVPVISIERTGGNFKQINNDNFTGGKLAADLLIRNGCEVFLHINNDFREDWPSFKRILGFEYEVKNRCYERLIEKKFTDTYTQEATESMGKTVRYIMEKYPGKKIGVFCSNDDIASLFEKQCIQNGIAIPDTIELVGYDNSPVSNYAIYPITSIDQNIPLMAQIAIQSLENYLPYESMVPAALIEKETTSRGKA